MASADRPKLDLIATQALSQIFLKCDEPLDTVESLRPVDDLATVSMVIEVHCLDGVHFIKEEDPAACSLLFTWNGLAFFVDKGSLLLQRGTFTAPYMVFGSVPLVVCSTSSSHSA